MSVYLISINALFSTFDLHNPKIQSLILFYSGKTEKTSNNKILPVQSQCRLIILHEISFFILFCIKYVLLKSCERKLR